VVNLLPITCLTRLFLPKMIQRNKTLNKRSAIINLSSSSVLTPLECSSNYCSTKIYDDMFTQTVAIEYRNEPVDFLAVRPFLVTSTMTRGQNTFLHVTPNHCAEGALRDLGRHTVSYGHWWHRIQGALTEELNGKLMNLLLCQVNRGLSATYKQIDSKNK
jgi:17beta-estradiol 17-dehydrogenase / very-long-chain 3-oxoacyl-CoA reductase